ncbi:unnamed protein product [Schistosoma mattheei]|uniref:Uncharacterized protein n=1 Tax=Schistosoma mattheei TaxID=31246 RepID=A0A183PJ76_9TREM|nr:unnamed protein product [Schistosoma mattheei]
MCGLFILREKSGVLFRNNPANNPRGEILSICSSKSDSTGNGRSTISNQISAYHFSPGGYKLYFALNSESGKEINSLSGHTYRISYISVQPVSGRYGLSTALSETILWDLDTSTCRCSKGHYLFAAGRSPFVYLWDLKGYVNCLSQDSPDVDHSNSNNRFLRELIKLPEPIKSVRRIEWIPKSCLIDFNQFNHDSMICDEVIVI